MTEFLSQFARIMTRNHDLDIRVDDFLTRDEVCKIIKINKDTLRTRIRSGQFPEPVSVAGQERWATSQINKFIYKTNPHLSASRDLRDEARAAIEEHSA
ncbi:AlpA family transcriptional regulator [Endozoicomonas sp. SESOKO4]|uniref:helix-turn-helix transcriptional regulator n=1 Tax=Endozoicomonas sp. SESOKO4 TaxID=2828745 RepID=UPI0021496A51|nr:helix-turn-helix domain-containing protein [Endozoicomonas sp. SESOKO4]